MSKDDEFDLDSGEEDDLLALEVKSEGLASVTNGKRPLPDAEQELVTKRPKLEDDEPIRKRANELLKTYFGFDRFQHLQEKAIIRLIQGQSALVVFPTGGGKSLCYQLPALAIDGVTLIVSPLLALMRDQIEALRRRKISAISFDSTKTREEYMDAQESIRQGLTKIIYVTPERLNNEGFVESMIQLRQRTGYGVGLIAIDESHCVSEWGHAFRPDYLKVARFAKEIQAERVVCLTATATPKVASDICREFDIDETEGLFKTSSYRENLKLMVESIPSNSDMQEVIQEKVRRLTKFLEANKGSSIVYVTQQKQAELIATMLRRVGFEVVPYHAGMETELRQKHQDLFMEKPNIVVVATIAFGMGIDKSDIRNVVHYDFPRSLEGYSQEIGRAGRDGLPSTCLLYLCGNDWKVREGMCRGDTPRLKDIRGLLEEIYASSIGLRVGDVIEVRSYDQSKLYDVRPTVLGNLYAQLELRFGLLRAVTPKYSKYSYKELATFDSAKADPSPEAKAILAMAERKATWSHLDVDSISRAKGLERTSIVRKLNMWNDAGWIDMKANMVVNRYKILKPLPANQAEKTSLAAALHSEVAKRDAEALERTRSVIDWATSSSCLSIDLAEYFGDQLSTKKDCGHCSFCLTRTAAVYTPAPITPIDYLMSLAVLAAVPKGHDVDALLLARLAFGISGPRVSAMRLGKNKVFGSMDDCNFEDLVNHFQTLV